MRKILRLLIPVLIGCLSIATVVLVSTLAGSSTSVAQTSDIAWARQFGTSADESATSIAVTAKGDVYVVGWTDGVLPGEKGSGSRDAFARRYAADGTVVWSHQFGTTGVDVANAADVDPTGDLVVGGQVGGTLPGQQGSGPADAFVRKYAADGTEQWTRQFGAKGESAVGQVRTVGAGLVFASGWVYGALPGQTWLGQYDAFVRHFDATGRELFTAQFGTPNHDRTRAEVGDGLGGLRVLVGSNPDPNARDARDNKKNDSLVSLDQTGKRAASPLAAPTADLEEVTGSTVTTAGEMVLVGQLTEHGRAFVRKVDATSTTAWTKQIQMSDIDTAVAVVTDPSGAVYVTGNMATPAAASTDLTHIWVQKYAANGSLLWTRQIATSGKDVVTSLAVSGGTVYLAGWTRGTFPGQANAGRSSAFVAKLI
jgi:hypothetical protein